MSVIQKIPVRNIPDLEECMEEAAMKNKHKVLKYLIDWGRVNDTCHLLNLYMDSHYDNSNMDTGIFDILFDKCERILLYPFFFMKDKEKQEHCLRRLKAKYPNIDKRGRFIYACMRKISSNWYNIPPNKKAEYIKNTIRAVDYLIELGDRFHYDVLLFLYLRYVMGDNVELTKFLFHHLLRKTSHTNITHLSEYAKNVILLNNPEFLVGLIKHFGVEDVIGSKPSNKDFFKYILSLGNRCDLIRVVFPFIVPDAKKMELIEKLKKMVKTCPYDKDLCLAIIKQIESGIEITRGVSSLRSAVRTSGRTGPIRQHQAKSILKNRISDFNEAVVIYNLKKEKGLKNPLEATKRQLRSAHPQNVFTNKRLKRTQLQSFPQSLRKTGEVLPHVAGMDQALYSKLMSYISTQPPKQKNR